MKTTKMSLANIQGKLNRTEMKSIMAGSGSYNCYAIASPGYHVQSPGSCSGSQSGCQSACNSWCNYANHCTSCTCY